MPRYHVLLKLSAHYSTRRVLLITLLVTDRTDAPRLYRRRTVCCCCYTHCRCRTVLYLSLAVGELSLCRTLSREREICLLENSLCETDAYIVSHAEVFIISSRPYATRTAILLEYPFSY